MPVDVTTALNRLRYAVAADEVLRRLEVLSEACKANFDPSQPRVPAGNPDGGRWTSTGRGSGGGAADRAPRTRMPRRGHHYVPREIFRKLPIPAEARRILDGIRTGPLNSGWHRWSEEHKIYNRAVAEHMRDFLRSNNIRAEEMTPEQARSFAKKIQESRDPRIRNYNLNILRREILYYFRHGPRRLD
jgi:hypothetical protein